MASMRWLLAGIAGRYVVGEDWQPKKLDVSIPMPEELDVSELRATGLQDGETEMPEGGGGASVRAPVILQYTYAPCSLGREPMSYVNMCCAMRCCI